jgi:hexokinase
VRLLVLPCQPTPFLTLCASGGTNLRVAFVELLGTDGDTAQVNGAGVLKTPTTARQLKRHLEHSWPIQDHLKNENSESLFAWIGSKVLQVVAKGSESFDLPSDEELSMGVTFSFPMKQSSLSQATLMAMGKGFAITSNLDLGGHLLKGYEKHRKSGLPPIRIAAISNDAVATLVSFIYQFPAAAHQKAAMGLIVGTGCNATIPLKLSSLHQDKRPVAISVSPDQDIADVKIAVNTEWSINGTAPPLRKFGLITHWDEELDKMGEAPGFQPLEYMTAGRYLGELARLIFVDYLTTVEGMSTDSLPKKLQQRFGLTTTFISQFLPGSERGPILNQLEAEFPVESFRWTEEVAHALYRIAKAIEIRAAGIIAAATVGLLKCAGELEVSDPRGKELVVGYTGGCIQYFQDYLADTQRFLDEIMKPYKHVKVALQPCHDGGITGAGILVPAALAGRVVEN